MSRIKRFTHSLLSGYMQLGVNGLFTLFTVRLALHYLSDDEYGLWIPTTVIASYIALMDFGLSSAASRILIDYKDHEKPEEYGGLIQTSVWVGLCQAALIFLVGTLLAFVLGPLLRIPAKLDREFFWLVIGQCGVTAAMFATRIVALILTANQRFDVTNYSGALALPVNCGVMWWGFAHGAGVFSMLWGQAAGFIAAVAMNWMACYKLNLFPRKGQWGRPSWEKFRELFAFGRDVFLFMIGNQFVNFSQTLLLTRLIGLKEALTWGICTRAYAILVQVIGRFFDFSTSALAEMMVRGEREQLLRRFRDIEVLSVNLAVAAGVLFAVGNGPFVEVWTAGRIRWSPWNDLLLAVWLVICIIVRVHTGLVGQSKAFRFMRYLYFIEGLAFIGLTVLLHQFGGITMMLMISILCSLCFTLRYGLWRTREYFHLSWGDLARWHRDTLTLAASVAPVGMLVWWFTRNLPGLQRLIVEMTVLGIWTVCMLLRYGLGYSLRADASRCAPGWARPLLNRVGFAKTENSEK
jgi:O-antigen/teichoic acid export membrane protein